MEFAPSLTRFPILGVLILHFYTYMVDTTTITSINQFPTTMYSQMSSTGKPVDEISEFLIFTVTDSGHFEFYALENSARLF